MLSARALLVRMERPANGVGAGRDGPGAVMNVRSAPLAVPSLFEATRR